MDKHDGGTAFPLLRDYTDNSNSETTHYVDYCERGMSLRDYFAGQALAGIASKNFPNTSYMQRRDIAGWAYSFADAMLAERKKQRKKQGGDK
jgi:hypothetical protein